MKLLNKGNAKTIKGEKFGYRTYGVHLSPSNKSGFNVCKWASAGCRAACLDTAGRGCMSNVQTSRISKTRLFFQNRDLFMRQLTDEIEKAIRSAKRAGLTPCFRLNLTSDIEWEHVRIDGLSLMETFPNVTFYDYSKGYMRMLNWLAGKLPRNYHLTFSRAENTAPEKLKTILDLGGNVAVVFRGSLPETFLGYSVIDGDESDLRFGDQGGWPYYRDAIGSVVGLVEKGLAKKDETGFVLESNLQGS